MGTPTLSDTLGTQEEIEAARETYLALTPEAKAIFDELSEVYSRYFIEEGVAAIFKF